METLEAINGLLSILSVFACFISIILNKEKYVCIFCVSSVVLILMFLPLSCSTHHHKHEMKMETYEVNDSTNLYVMRCSECDSTFLKTTDKETYADFIIEQNKLK